MDRYSGTARAPAAADEPGPRTDGGRRPFPRTPFGATAPTYTALVAVLAAIIVWSPALGEVYLSVMVIGFASVGLMLLDASRRSFAAAADGQQRTPRRRALLVTTVAVFLAGFGASFLSVMAGQSSNCLPIAIIAFLLLLGGVWAHERAVAP